MYDGNYGNAAVSMGSLMLFDRFGSLGKVAKLTEQQQYIWDTILFPFTDTFNKLVE